MQKILAQLKKYKPSDKGVFFGFLLSFILLFLLFPWASESITLWDRTIGPATLAGIDIQKRTSSFSTLHIFWIPLVAFIISIICTKSPLKSLFKATDSAIFKANDSTSSKNAPASRRTHAFIFYLATISAVFLAVIPLPALLLGIKQLAIHGIFFTAVIALSFTAFKKTRFFEKNIQPSFAEQTVAFPILLFTAIAAYTSKYLIPFLATKSDLYRQVSETSIQDGSLVCVLFALSSFWMISLLDVQKKWSPRNPAEHFCSFLCTSISLVCFAGVEIRVASLITFIAFAAASLLLTRKASEARVSAFNSFYKGITWVPAIATIGMEAFYILAEKGLHVPHPCIDTLLICAVFIWIQKKWPCRIYLGTLVSLCAIAFFSHAYQQTWHYNDYAYLYEMGNKTVALSSLLNGDLPILNYFSAHALFDVWTQILHATISPGIVGILADPYGGLNDCIALLIVFFILKKLISPAAAILFVVLFPFNALGIKAYNICFVAVLAYGLFQKNFSLQKSFLFWIAIAINAFFLYDDGISLGIAAIVATCIMFLCNRDKTGLAKFMGAGIATGAFLALAAYALCIAKGIAPAERLKEWLDLTLKSSAIWATESFGNSHSPFYVFAYFIAPASASFALYFTAYKSISQKKMSFAAGATIIFAFAELLFIPRGIIFHNLTEGNGIAGRLLNFWPWTMSCFAVFLLETKSKQQQAKDWCWAIVFGSSLFVAGLTTRYLPNANCQLASASVTAAAQFHAEMQKPLKGERIVYSNETTEFIKPLKNTLDSLLAPSETFLDFSNSTALYAMLERKSPAYVAQTPGLLSTEFTQKQFIQQIENSSAPVAIIGNANLPYLREMTWEPHNIPHNIRYYLVAEYIYSHYKPFKIIGDYALWCKPERCNDFLPYDYDSKINSAHHYALKMLPYIWANHDKFKGVQNPIATDLHKANYLEVSVENKTSEVRPALLKISSEDSLHQISFEFSVLPGTHSYLIRVSADSYWYGYNMREVELNGTTVNEAALVLQSAKFLEEK